MALVRLQKLLAESGLGSRRSCEQLITQGRVTVDGRRVTELGAKADLGRQEVRCDGEIVRRRKKVYYLLNKPRGVVCTSRDEQGRRRAVDLVPARDQRLFTVGRLDADTEGLLVITNDGDFAQRVAHPRYGVAKTYLARVRGAMSNAAKRSLLEGVWVAGRRCRADWARVVRRSRNESLVEVTLHEGRNRAVRRMLGSVGFPTIQLRRVRIGCVEDDTLRPGRWRKLSVQEIGGLLEGTRSAT